MRLLYVKHWFFKINWKKKPHTSHKKNNFQIKMKYDNKIFSSWDLSGAFWTKAVLADEATLPQCMKLAVTSHLPVNACWLQLAAGRRRINQCCHITMQMIRSSAGRNNLTFYAEMRTQSISSARVLFFDSELPSVARWCVEWNLFSWKQKTFVPKCH